ncbi:hypothetical protein TWF102_006955 [Orbilia oligospora]|uniref:Uncharacterized protein n=1 Tax=Orbilia oligospora TaxID=2813651 RepID=A0A7C8NVN3_ORBOL|nr:hypothetical protein TWF103_005828 [Orbilia oligospora]KAF3111282.1 hypothetical protein TWF102_006955 [Orbilia oligospora]
MSLPGAEKTLHAVIQRGHVVFKDTPYYITTKVSGISREDIQTYLVQRCPLDTPANLAAWSFFNSVQHAPTPGEKSGTTVYSWRYDYKWDRMGEFAYPYSFMITTTVALTDIGSIESNDWRISEEELQEGIEALSRRLRRIRQLRNGGLQPAAIGTCFGPLLKIPDGP